jgi:hypothetical protein
MKVSNMFFAAAFTLFTTILSAGNISGAEGEKKLSTEIKTMIQKIDFQESTEESFLVNFLVNSKNELIVTSTTLEGFDQTIKDTLNYKTVSGEDVEKNKIYTIKVNIAKK